MTGEPITFSRYDADPDALAWARGKVEREVERMRKFEADSARRPDGDPKGWRRVRFILEHSFIGGEGCVIAAFDERRPKLIEQLGDQAVVS